MGRPSLEVADILNTHGDAYIAAHAGHLSLGQLKVMSAIRALPPCSTAGDRRSPTIPMSTSSCPAAAYRWTRWIACKLGFFLPVRVLSRLFRRLFLGRLAALHKADRLAFFGELAGLMDRNTFDAALAPLRRAEWVVYAKRPFAGPGAVLAYLSRYTHRVAISNNRLVALGDNGVTFRWKDYRIKGKTAGNAWIKTMNPADGRVHPPLPAPRAARRLSPHPPLRPVRQWPSRRHQRQTAPPARRNRYFRPSRARPPAASPNRHGAHHPAMPMLRRSPAHHRTFRPWHDATNPPDIHAEGRYVMTLVTPRFALTIARSNTAIRPRADRLSAQLSQRRRRRAQAGQRRSRQPSASVTSRAFLPWTFSDAGRQRSSPRSSTAGIRKPSQQQTFEIAGRPV
jgi:hypothetical protein